MGSGTATAGQANRAVIPEDMDNPITPGEILLEEYLKPMGISQNTMARAIGVASRAINEIVHAKRSITPAMSIRFGAFFDQSDKFGTCSKSSATFANWPEEEAYRHSIRSTSLP